ncbi:MAG TPA: 50S ribosomal protein L5 [Candidatus Syntrophoarchaeum butanivorans]|uniref:Large ribosomal subunit protein uL5 n=1 Tax=Candidatus Syntropharchaeum butanivorans TaxID=1839936 RepID=A0A1F2P6W2_9EURY|nr:MAG: Ribosomal protein L5 [Candidatus Syntrophoarchaeum butanivorans]RJS72499.1 MAG: 50S ribosomal protein L5 [Candidatus Syntrophoarchaeum sp. WYZ-LMO15]HEC56715.1 50S ribosomal protein L5 [Candidatus Syntrophoarchaeum butanivorans]
MENKMREVLIDKVVVNMGVGESGIRLNNAERVLEEITGQKPVRTISKRTRQPFGIKKGESIGCKVTLRKDRAERFLKDALSILNNMISDYQFDETGSFSFGIEEHTDFPGMEYDPDIGIFGMDISVSLRRRGYRVSKRRKNRKKIPKRHRVTREDAMEFLRSKFGVTIVEWE